MCLAERRYLFLFNINLDVVRMRGSLCLSTARKYPLMPHTITLPQNSIYIISMRDNHYLPTRGPLFYINSISSGSKCWPMAELRAVRPEISRYKPPKLRISGFSFLIPVYTVRAQTAPLAHFSRKYRVKAKKNVIGTFYARLLVGNIID